MQYFKTADTTIYAMLMLALAPLHAYAGFNSGSTGADGAFNPTASTTIDLPANGIFNYTTVNIPSGVTIKYKKNATNTPVVILASGDVTLNGTIDISGGASANVGTNPALDYTTPGRGGPGGFDGGYGGSIEVNQRGGNGQGPGAGGGGNHVSTCCSGYAQGGGGASYRYAGNDNTTSTSADNTGLGNKVPYGSNLLMPLMGGSGGGGGAGGSLYQGSGGGGGGGAILIAASGSLAIGGYVLANGGNAGGNPNGSSAANMGACGGGGSGGAIRLVASNITASASALSVSGGTGNCSGAYAPYGAQYGGNGSAGRTRSDVATSGTLTIGGFPTLTIASVGGIAAPATPTGSGDITLATDLPNPVTVVFNTTGVPVTNTIKLTVTPTRGLGPTVVTSGPLSGTTSSATASVNVDIPMGSSTLLATTSYTIVASLGDALSTYAQGERVEKIELAATTHGPSMVTLITVSGKRYTMPSSQLPVVAFTG